MILLLILIVFVGLLVYRGYRKGAMLMLLSVGSLFLSFILVRLIAPFAVSALESNEEFYNDIRQPIYETLSKDSEGESTEKVLDKVYITDEMKKNISDNADSLGIGNLSIVSDGFLNIVADSVTGFVITIICYVVLFVLINILLRLLGKILKVVDHLPIIHQANRLLGVILGFIEAIIIVWIFLFIITIFCTSGIGSWCMEQIQSNDILSFIYVKNVLLHIL